MTQSCHCGACTAWGKSRDEPVSHSSRRAPALELAETKSQATYLWRVARCSTQLSSDQSRSATLAPDELHASLGSLLVQSILDSSSSSSSTCFRLPIAPTMADRPPKEPSPSPSSSHSNIVASRSSTDSARSPPSRTSSLRLGSISSANQHRQSFSESLRGLPPSPRSQRQLSISQLAIQDLIDNPPARSNPDPAFAGRDWRSISVAELVSPEDLKFVEIDTGVEAATNVRQTPYASLRDEEIDSLT